ncbi:MAG: redoxin domain-containing protein, partial [Woeseia sp.]
MPRFIITLTAACLMVAALATAALAESVAAGKAAPNFDLTDQNGRTHSLDDYRDQWVVLYFYPKDDTPGCTT